MCNLQNIFDAFFFLFFISVMCDSVIIINVQGVASSFPLKLMINVFIIEEKNESVWLINNLETIIVKSSICYFGYCKRHRNSECS